MAISHNSIPNTSAQLTLFAEEALVKVSAWRESAKAWTEQVASSGTSSVSSIASLLLWCSGRTSLACSLPTTATISPSFFGPSPATILQSLRVAGVIPAFVSGPSEPARGGFLTLNTQEFHSAAVASSLSEILETGPAPSKYYLSPRACQGILRRAKRRGKSLPPSLQAALEQVARQGSDPKPTS